MSDELVEALPNCPECLHQLEPAGTDEHPYWECPNCGHVAVSV